jgi:hypothetical protein
LESALNNPVDVGAVCAAWRIALYRKRAGADLTARGGHRRTDNVVERQIPTTAPKQAGSPAANPIEQFLLSFAVLSIRGKLTQSKVKRRIACAQSCRGNFGRIHGRPPIADRKTP